MLFHLSSFLRRGLCAALLLLGFILPGAALAQEEEEEKKPVFVTVRVFQGRIKRGSNPDLSDQTFKLNTRSLTDYEKWVTMIGKAYPDLEIAQIRTQMLRVFMSNTPAKVQFGPKNGRNIRLDIIAAQSPGDGVTPGLNLVPVVEYHFGDDKADMKYKPVTQAFPPPIEVEPGMTYFFTNKNLSYSPESYVKFVRPGISPGAFGMNDYYFIFALTHELTNPLKPGGDTPTARILTDQQSAQAQANATKKVEPEWPAEIERPGYDGQIQVRVEINPDGRVGSASIWNSSLPEANRQAIAAARAWEFPATLFAESQTPVFALLTFTYTAPKPKTEQPASATTPPATPARPPVKAAPKRSVKPKKKQAADQ